jgi:MFS-type transporter involved in bile tolerance (Atg22 family)
LIQFFINMATGPYQALMPDLIPLEFHGKASAYMGLWQLVGRTGGMVAGALLADVPNGVTILSIAFIVLLLTLMTLTVTMTREEPLTPEARSSVTDSIRNALRVDLRGNPSFTWVLVYRFVINTGIYTITTFLLYYLINCLGLTKHAANGQLALIGLTVNLTGMAATFPAGIAADRFSKKSVVYVTCAISIVGGVVFAMSGSVLYAMVAAGIFGFGYGAFQAVDWALVCNVLPPGEPAKYMGVWGIADCVPQIVAPFLGGAISAWAIARFGPDLGHRAVMVSAIVWFALGTLAIRWVKERRPTDESAACPPPVTVPAAEAGGGL